MRTTELLNELKTRGVMLQARGDRLRVGPRDRISPELLAEVQAHKLELIDLLVLCDESLTHQPVHSPPWLQATELVWTSAGHASVVAALPERVVVALEQSPGRFEVFLPAEVRSIEVPHPVGVVPMVTH